MKKPKPARPVARQTVPSHPPPVIAPQGQVVAPTRVGMVVQQESATLHIGPLPPPDDFGAYNQVVPGGAERILAMAEADAANVRLTQRRSQVFLFVERIVARVLSALFASGALLLAGYLALHGHEWIAGIIASTTIGAVVAALIYGRGPGSGQS